MIGEAFLAIVLKRRWHVLLHASVHEFILRGPRFALRCRRAGQLAVRRDCVGLLGE